MLHQNTADNVMMMAQMPLRAGVLASVPFVPRKTVNSA